MLVLCLAMIALLRLAPGLVLSRTLHRLLVEEPVRQLAALDRTRLLTLVVLGLLLCAGAEVFVLMGSAEMAFVLATQIALYLDAVAVSIVAAVALRARPLVQWLGARLQSRGRRSPRHRRTRRPAVRSLANDDDPAPLLLAA
ncbi:hypothetical protein GCM10022280_20520 [Sphingomonas swuensis]|uniref:Uncharacterized protein n=1 Tax=Sphingomonas swuensis TaxID=977800 RepID=A0ABP7T2L8_9SPHN